MQYKISLRLQTDTSPTGIGFVDDGELRKPKVTVITRREIKLSYNHVGKIGHD